MANIPVHRKSFQVYTLICQTSPVHAAQAKDSTLGTLTKRRRVGAGLALGRDCLNCLDRKPRRFPMVSARCARKTRENEKRSRKSGKADESPCSEGGNNKKLYSVELATTIYAFYVSRGWSVR